MEVLKRAQRSSHLKNSLISFIVVRACHRLFSSSRGNSIASQSPGIVFPDQVASETEGGVLLQGLGYLEASIKALSIIVDHNFSG